MSTLLHMGRSQTKEAIQFARKRRIFTAAKAARHGLHSQILTRLVRERSVERVARGQYYFSEQPVSEHHTPAVVGRAVPGGVVCLPSALSVHGIGTQVPAQVWLAIPRQARHPKLQYPPLRIVKFSWKAFTKGIEIHQIERQPVGVYGIAKTLADLFKYRNQGRSRSRAGSPVRFLERTKIQYG
jgi:predicted transcriptional regulator of viral defense system